MRMVSADGHWRVSPIILNGQPLLRVESDSPVRAGFHGDGIHRCGPVMRAGGWWWAGDVRKPADIELWVPLAELREEEEAA